MNKKLYLVLLMNLALSACAANGPRFVKSSVSGGEASITIYRPSKFQAGGGYPYLFIDDNYLGSLKNGGYISQKVTPGTHKVLVTGAVEGKPDYWAIPRAQVEISAEAGESYYIKVEPSVRFVGGVIPQASVQVIEKKVAEAEIIECKKSN